MSLSNPNKPVTEQRLSEFYQQILPYLGGMPDILANKFARGDMYSTDEKMIGRWIDGKPLYQKTWSGFDVTCSSSAWTILSDVDISDAKSIIDCKTFDGDSNTQELRSYTANATKSSNGKLQIFNTRNANTSVVAVTLQYTKTNDATVNIGTGNDYSTDEQIIGTWIDGKPLYQKTIRFTNLNIPQNSSNNLIDVSSLNIDELVNLQETGKEGDNWFRFDENTTRTFLANNILTFTTVTYWDFSVLIITLQYTKTTD